MQFFLTINAAPNSVTAHSAFRFCQSLLEQKHEIYRLFFHGPAVLHAALDNDAEQPNAWATLIDTHKIDAVCCINSCIHHQLIPENQPTSRANLREQYIVSGIGQMVEAQLRADRSMTFGERLPPGSERHDRALPSQEHA